MMSAALFGRRSKKGPDDPAVTSASGNRGAPSGPNVFAPDADRASEPPGEAVPVADADDPAAVGSAPVDPTGSSDGEVCGDDPEHDRLIGGPLLAELEARIHSSHPAPHPVRPQEMWHPGVTPLPVDLPPPPNEERIDQAELNGTDSAPGRFRFNRLRRVSPGEAPSDPIEVPASDPAREEPIGDVLFGELFTSDRIPSGTEGLGSGAAPLVPRSGGASGALINGPVRRSARDAGPVLHPPPGTHREPQVDEPDDRFEDGDPDELPVAASVAPSGEPTQDLVDDRIPDADDDHDADPVAEPTVAAEQASQPQLLVAGIDGSVDVGGTSLRLATDADAIVADHGSIVSVRLSDGWCWVALGDDERPIEVVTVGTSLQCGAATTALAAVDDTGRFVVVVRGEAVLSVGVRRIRLRTGAMAFLPHGSDEAQVDVASEIEVATDPLVALNLGLDAKR